MKNATMSNVKSRKKVRYRPEQIHCIHLLSMYSISIHLQYQETIFWASVGKSRLQLFSACWSAKIFLKEVDTVIYALYSIVTFLFLCNTSIHSSTHQSTHTL